MQICVSSIVVTDHVHENTSVLLTLECMAAVNKDAAFHELRGFAII